MSREVDKIKKAIQRANPMAWAQYKERKAKRGS